MSEPKTSEPKNPQDDPAQSQRFRDMAQEVEAEDNPQAFERALGVVASTPPGTPKRTSPQPKSGSRRTNVKP